MLTLGNHLLNKPQFPTLTSIMSSYTAHETRQETSHFGLTSTRAPVDSVDSTTCTDGDNVLLASPTPTSSPQCSNKHPFNLFALTARILIFVETCNNLHPELQPPVPPGQGRGHASSSGWSHHNNGCRPIVVVAPIAPPVDVLITRVIANLYRRIDGQIVSAPRYTPPSYASGFTPNPSGELAFGMTCP